ncbi:Ribitol 2dehydrogenase EC 11156 CDS [Bradyrhizobium sp.]|nr:Ribitol 2dehydrogenase EC 11156 CDS [Bradyrhizobium sp.]
MRGEGLTVSERLCPPYEASDPHRQFVLYRYTADHQQDGAPMGNELEGKVAAVTGAASGIGLASTEAMLAAGARVVMVDRDEAALKALGNKHGDAVIPLVVDLLDPKDCASLLPRVLEKAGQLDILHANAGTYVGGDLVDADNMAIDRMLNLNVNVVMKNVHDVLPHMIARGSGDIIVTSSLAAHFPTPWEPVYASSKWAINCFVQTVRRQVFKHGIRVGSISPGPVVTSLLADWPTEKRGMTIRDVVMLPTNFDL